MADMDLRIELPTEPGAPLKGSVARPDGVKIAYEVHGLTHDFVTGEHGAALDKRPKVLMVMGLACGRSGWRWQLQDLMRPQSQQPCAPVGVAGGWSASGAAGAAAAAAVACPRQWSGEHGFEGAAAEPAFAPPVTSSCAAAAASVDAAPAGEQPPMVVCVLDNRGVGESSAPEGRAAYTTSTMAADALAVMDQLGWESAHVVGFSMGGMISTRLAVLAPQRVRSLTLISVTAGGWQIIPWSARGLQRGARLLLARTPEDQVDATLHMHFTKRTLREWVARYRASRQDLLRREYLTPSGPPQPPHGFQGQIHACWHHGVSDQDVQTIKQAGFPICVIHGRYDALASPAYGEQLARRLAAPLVMLQGAHFIVRECAGQVNMLLSSLVLGPQHIHAASNARYLDPDAAIQKAWQAAAASAAAAATSSAPPAGERKQHQQRSGDDGGASSQQHCWHHASSGGHKGSQVCWQAPLVAA